jgi:AbrB family looped-hinge helix DNA binding protein
MREIDDSGYTAGMTSMSTTYKMGPKGQVVIPKTIRDRLHLKPGDDLVVRGEGDEVRIRRAALDQAERRERVARLRGMLSDGSHDLVAELEAEHRAEVEADEREMRERGL